MDPAELLKQFQSKKTGLRPTATVVRGRDGKITVENEDLLSDAEKHQRVKVSIDAGKIRKGLPKHLIQNSQEADFPIVSGVVYEYGKDDGPNDQNSWNPLAKNDADPTMPSDLRIVSFNVWFSEYEWKTRMEALVGMLLHGGVHVACLQEVTSRFLQGLMDHPSIQQRYRIVHSVAPKSWYGVAMLLDIGCISAPIGIEILPLPSKMGRTALVANLANKLVVATVHLESLESRPFRTKQLQIIHETLQKYPYAVLLGDMNITGTGPWAAPDEELELLKTSRSFRFVDCWLQQFGSDNPGMTFDTIQNTMLAKRTRFEDTSRLDRAFLKRAIENPEESEWNLKSIEIVGNTPVGTDADENPLFISDHFGLALHLEQ